MPFPSQADLPASPPSEVTPLPLRAEFRPELRRRFGFRRRLKAIGIPTFIGLFFAAYFALLRHPFFPPTTMPLTWLDGLDFSAWAVIPYASLWMYVVLPPSLLGSRRETRTYAATLAGLTLTGLGVYCVWPTIIPQPEIDWSRFASFAFLKRIDATGNSCPSLHAAFAVFSAIWLESLLRSMHAPRSLRIGNAAWCAAIVYSTLATKQHVAVDVLAGVALGGAAGLPVALCAAPYAFGSPYSILNRQALAFGVSIVSKVALFALDLPTQHPIAAVVVFLAPDLWILTGLLIPNTSILLPTATCFATPRREVWLTIDDGPEPDCLPAVLQLLDQRRCRATFFLIGAKAAAHPGLVGEILRRGHTIGYHTRTHPLATFWLAGPRRTAREVGTWPEPADPHSGRWFRAPAGIKSFFLRHALARQGAVLVGWSARGRENPGPGVAAPLKRLKGRIRPGAIILIHESAAHPAERVALLAGLLEHLGASGYACTIPRQDQLRPAFAADEDGDVG